MLEKKIKYNRYFNGSVFSSLVTLIIMCGMNLAFATNYYVDCNGLGGGSGTSQNSAWNTTDSINAHGVFSAGDNILFKRGTYCNLSAGLGNEIKPTGSGVSGNVITLGTYGSGEKPVISQNGNNSIILLDNISHWAIRNLKLVGSGASDGLDKKGIFVKATLADVNGITISGVDISNVRGLDKKFGGGSAGILFYNKDELNFEFHNILIENNSLTNVHRGGIEFASAIQSEVSASNPPFTLNPAKKSTSVVIRNNTLSQIGGDGIVLDGTDGAIVENNTLDQIAVISTANNVAIWSRNAINSLFQSNVITNSRQAPGTSDGQSLDADWWGFNNIFQYNLSKNNQGGLALLCTNPESRMSATERSYIPAGANRAIFRYNISINDGYNDNALFPTNGNNARAFFTSCFLKPVGIEFYNNVFYVSYGGNVNLLRNFGHKLSRSNFYNNIFYAAPGTSINMNRSSTTLLDSLTDFRNNTMFGTVTDTPGHASNTTDNPQFVGPFNIAAGFKIQPTSPARDSGKLIANNGGRDFEGIGVSSTSAPNRGTYESLGAFIPSNEHIAHSSSGNRLNATGGLGSDITLVAASASVSQQWEIVAAGNGYYFIDNIASAVRLSAAPPSNDVNVVSSSLTGNNVQWSITGAGNGKVFITHRATGLKLHSSAVQGGVVNLTNAIWRGPNVQWGRSVAP